MKKIERVFREAVPDELVLKFFEAIGVKGKDDCKWFSKHVFTEPVCEKIQELLPLLEPYYYPHKQFIITRGMTELRYLQIYKQLAACMSYKLEKREAKGREVYKRKTILYRLASDKVKEELISFTVEFR
jgi:hypothetical protein